MRMPFLQMTGELTGEVSAEEHDEHAIWEIVDRELSEAFVARRAICL